MAKQTINIGTSANSKDGDIIRDAFNKTNQNFDEIYGALTDGINFSQVNSDWNAVSGVSSILNKPTIPTNTNQLTNGAGFITGTDKLVNGDHQFVLNVSGAGPYISFPADEGSQIQIQGCDITGIGFEVQLISAEDGVRLSANAGSIARKDWTFGTDGTLTLPGAFAYPNSALQRDIATVSCLGNASTVVYTASAPNQQTIKLLIQVEGSAPGDPYDTQACEMIIAKSFRANALAASVYGVVHTSVAPLATFTANWNALTSRVEVLCATTAIAVNVRIFATEITTSD